MNDSERRNAKSMKPPELLRAERREAWWSATYEWWLAEYEHVGDEAARDMWSGTRDELAEAREAVRQLKQPASAGSEPFVGGESVDIIGSPLKGNPGIVLTATELKRLGAEPRNGLVPVYTPQFPATRFWWMAACHLRLAKAPGRQDEPLT